MDCGSSSGKAIAYAITAYKTAYLKYYYPIEFMTAIINNQKSENGSADFDSVMNYIKVCKDMGINISHTDINSSTERFVPDTKNNSILFGFGLVKGLSKSGIETIMPNRPFDSYKDFIDRVGLELNKSDVISLIKSGSFNSICNEDKMKLFKIYYSVRFDNKKEDTKPISKANKNHIQWLLDNGYITPEQGIDREYCTSIINKVRKSQGWDKFKEDYCQGTELDWEMETLNAHLSGNPFENVVIPNWDNVANEDIGYIGGVIIDVKEVVIKNGKSKGQKMCFLNIDYKGKVADIVVFSKLYQDYNPIFKVGNCVVCTVKKQGELNGVLQGCETLQEYLTRTAQIQTQYK